DKVPPTPARAVRAGADRVQQLADTIGELDAKIADGQEELRRMSAGLELLPPTVTANRRGGDGAAAALVAQEQAVSVLRARRRAAVNERDQLRAVGGLPPLPPPHAHLRNREVPDVAAPANALLRFWSGASLSVLLLLIGLALLLEQGSLVVACTLAVLLVMGIEAVLRRRLLVFLLSLLILIAVGWLTWLLVTNLRFAFGVLAVAAAVAIGVANLRNLFGRR
ncbi:hypothetical protein, partial [Catellatospora methionotrophica]|uniref:hypothetical protein n=1 Tax=Catellatospora methionotrophica TaxID=121620 RepID=UPI0033EE61E5